MNLPFLLNVIPFYKITLLCRLVNREALYSKKTKMFHEYRPNNKKKKKKSLSLAELAFNAMETLIWSPYLKEFYRFSIVTVVSTESYRLHHVEIGKIDGLCSARVFLN